MVYIQMDRKLSLPAFLPSVLTQEQAATSCTGQLQPCHTSFISSYTITAQVNMTHLCRQNCTTRQTPCCTHWRRVPVYLCKYPEATLKISLLKAERKTNTASDLFLSLQCGERVKLKMEKKKRAGSAVPTRLLLHLAIGVAAD